MRSRFWIEFPIKIVFPQGTRIIFDDNIDSCTTDVEIMAHISQECTDGRLAIIWSKRDQVYHDIELFSSEGLKKCFRIISVALYSFDFFSKIFRRLSSIEKDYFMTIVKEAFGDVVSKKSRASDDEYSHNSSFFRFFSAKISLSLLYFDRLC